MTFMGQKRNAFMYTRVSYLHYCSMAVVLAVQPDLLGEQYYLEFIILEYLNTLLTNAFLTSVYLILPFVI
ncbi:hypothetical protein BJV82DRAFT_638842, partial [Fennellomyces sp. T-0311]